MPVSSFAPELLQLFKIAAQQEVVVLFDTEKEAQRFRFRCHYLRREMRKSGHDLVSIANSVEFKIRKTKVEPKIADGKAPDKAQWAVIASPSDTSFVEKLHTAGIKIELPSSPPEHHMSNPQPKELTPMTNEELEDSQLALKKFLEGDKEDEG